MNNQLSPDAPGLADIVAGVEHRLLGSSAQPGVELSDLIPGADTFVLILFDGLGIAQMEHPAAAPFRSSLAKAIHSPFPSTTSVSLATIATGLAPAKHGQVGHLSWFPDLGMVVNTLKWVTPGGDSVPYEYGSVLPGPNLWERLRAGGLEPITVQPRDFSGSPLTRVLYRGARFEGAWDTADLVDATVTLAGEPRRLIFTYVPFVDLAGHIHGQGSEQFTEAMKAAANVWEGVLAGVPPGVTVLGTADHGLVEVAESDKILVREPKFDDLRFAGDTRGVQLWGEGRLIDDLADLTGGELIDPVPLLGSSLSETSSSRLGEQLLLAPPGRAIIPRGFDKRLRCYHGGLSPEETEIPLLVG